MKGALDGKFRLWTDPDSFGNLRRVKCKTAFAKGVSRISKAVQQCRRNVGLCTELCPRFFGRRRRGKSVSGLGRSFRQSVVGQMFVATWLIIGGEQIAGAMRRLW